MGLKVVYVTLYPEQYPRVKKIATTLEGKDIKFQALTPRIRIRLGNRKIERLISAFITYTSFIFQISLAKADIYWIPNSPAIFVMPLILKKQPYILDYRSPWPLIVKLEFGKGPLSRMAEQFTHVALKYAKVVILTTSTLLKDVKKFEKRIYVVPNYPQKDSFKPDVSYDQFRKLQGVKKDERVILFMGRLSKMQGVDILPTIVEGLLQRKQKMLLWIVGDGYLRPEVEELERKFPKNVKFFGWRPHGEIPNFVNATDVCIIPFAETPFFHYYNEEGLNKISEFMFFRKPIVASGIAPSTEYLLVKRQDMVKGILEALEGKTPKPTRRTWEDECKEKVLEVIEFVKSSENEKGS